MSLVLVRFGGVILLSNSSSERQKRGTINGRDAQDSPKRVPSHVHTPPNQFTSNTNERTVRFTTTTLEPIEIISNLTRAVAAPWGRTEPGGGGNGHWHSVRCGDTREMPWPRKKETDTQMISTVVSTVKNKTEMKCDVCARQESGGIDENENDSDHHDWSKLGKNQLTKN